MELSNQKGFSLVEILVVVVIIGIIAAMAVPSLRKSVLAAENSNAFASLKTIASAQMSYYSTNKRFARLDELNGSQFGGLGQVSGTTMLRSGYTFQLAPNPSPTDADLAAGYTIEASRPAVDGVPYLIRVDQSGSVAQIFP